MGIQRGSGQGRPLFFATGVSGGLAVRAFFLPFVSSCDGDNALLTEGASSSTSAILRLREDFTAGVETREGADEDDDFASLVDFFLYIF